MVLRVKSTQPLAASPRTTPPLAATFLKTPKPVLPAVSVDILDFESKTQIWLVGTVFEHGFFVGDFRNFAYGLEVRPYFGKNLVDELVEDFVDVFLVYKDIST